MKKLIIYLLSSVSLFGQVLDLRRISELPSTNIVTTNDIMPIVSQPFSPNAVTRRILIQDLVRSLILPQVVTTNINVTYITNNTIVTTNIIVNGTNTPTLGPVTAPKLPYALTTNILNDSPISRLDGTTIGVPSVIASNSITGLGAGTNWISGLYIGGTNGFSVTNRAVDIRAFGASPSKADNSTNINNAIAMVATNFGGGIVEVPSGIFKIANSIILLDKVTLKGTSSVNDNDTNRNSIIYLADNANCHMLIKNDLVGGNIENLFFYGNKTNQTSTNLYGIWFAGSSIARSTIQNVSVRQVSGTGIQNDSRETRFLKVSSEQNLRHGFEITASSDTLMFEILAGFNGGYGVYLNQANSVRIYEDNLYRNAVGLYLKNANNNELFGTKTDANEKEGIVIEAEVGRAAYRNAFIGGTANANNFYLDHNGNATSYASGTYSNVKLIGDGAIENIFSNFKFWENEAFPDFITKPKYGLEDARNYYLTSNLPGLSITLNSCTFKNADTNWMALGAYNTNFQKNADGSIWYVDGVPTWKDNRYFSSLRTSQMRTTDQNESDLGLQVNGFYGVTNGGSGSAWMYRAAGPAFMFRGRNDNPMLGLQYAPAGVGSNLLTWTSALNVNSTNGAVAVGSSDSPAVSGIKLEVVGNLKSTFLETTEGFVVNGYYDGSWKRRANGPAYFQQVGANGIDDWILNIASTNLADTTITWVPVVIVGTNGDVTVPQLTATTAQITSGLSAPNITLNGTARNSWPSLSVKKNGGAVIGTRETLNFIEGADTSLAISDNAGGNRVDITITAVSTNSLTNIYSFTAPLTLAGTNVYLATNGVGDVHLRTSISNSVIGRASGTAGQVADIGSSATNQWLGNVNGSLAFQKIPSGITTQMVNIAKAGSIVAARKTINFIDGANSSVTVADNGGSDRIDVTVATTGASTINYGFSNYVGQGEATLANSFAVPTWTISGNNVETGTLTTGTYLVTFTTTAVQYRNSGGTIELKLFNTESGFDLDGSLKYVGPQVTSGSFTANWNVTLQGIAVITTSGKVQVKAQDSLNGGGSDSTLRGDHSTFSWIKVQ